MNNTISVLYAGSLTRLMDSLVGPAFERATGIAYHGEDGLGGAVALAEAIRDGRRTPDAFLAADGAQVMRLLMPPEAAFARWYVPFARATRVLAYSPKSRWRSEFERAGRGEVSWYSVLLQPGLRFGRSDPDLDPGGYLTLLTAQLAELAYAEPDLKHRLVGPDRNPDQMPPVDVLRRGLSTGEIDATLAYRNGLVDRDVPFIELPPEVSLSNPEYVDAYARASYTSGSGRTFRGGLVYYTATVLDAAANPAAGAAFVDFLLSSDVRQLLSQQGLVLEPPRVYGDASAAPAAVRART
jgi:molybdate/tungstate transport system substrate-binding protein